MRKAFNFYITYWQVGQELNDADRLKFYDALLKKQFTGEDTELKGMVKFAYLSQQYNIEKQIEGFLSKWNKLHPNEDPWQGGRQDPNEDPWQQEKEKEQEKVKDKEKETLFNDFWKLYDKSVDKKKCMDKWMKLSDKEITSIFEHLPNYIKYTPDKTYRKNPVTYLNGKCWNDEEYTKPITYNSNRERLDEYGFIYDPLVENMRKKGLI